MILQHALAVAFSSLVHVIKNIVFVGGSNARGLSYAAETLGVNSYNIATGGWKLTCENVDKLIPDLKDLMGSLPAGTPIVLFC
jgi:hypothetical protein